MALMIVGVMGPGETASPSDCAIAERLGQLIAREGWVALTGGRAKGVMEAALRGARRAGGLTVGVLPGDAAEDAADSVDIRIVTGIGEARNLINVLTSRVVFACGMSAGTASEIALALKTKRHAILLNPEPESAQFWASLGEQRLHIASGPEEAIEIAKRVLKDTTSKLL